MFGTFFSLLTIFCFATMFPDTTVVADIGRLFLIVLPIFLMFVTFVTTAITWKAIQRTEQKVFPRVYELIFKDYLFYCFIIDIIGFTFYSLYLAFTVANTGLLLHLLYPWVFLFGVSCDLMVFFVRRLLCYSNHQFLLVRLDKQVVRLVQKENDKEAFQWLETAIDVAARAIDGKNIHVAKDALRTVQGMCEHFMRAASKVEALRPLGQTGPSLLDEISYLCAYVCRRLEWLNILAMKNNFDPINEDIVNTLGKMSIFFAKHNPEVAKLPLLFAERAGRAALAQNRDELAIQYCCIISEVTKALLVIAKEKRESRKEAVLAALQNLESLVTAIFQKNREMNTVLLMQPFAEVAQLLGDQQFTDLIDREEIVTELKRILQSFGALDSVITKLQPKSSM